MPKQQHQKQPAAAKTNPIDLYYTVYTTDEQLRGYLARYKEELDLNSPVFQRRLPDLMKKHEGEFVLMRNGRMLGFFGKEEEAHAEGNRRFKDCVFSVLEVDDTVYDLGIFSRI